MYHTSNYSYTYSGPVEHGYPSTIIGLVGSTPMFENRQIKMYCHICKHRCDYRYMKFAAPKDKGMDMSHHADIVMHRNNADVSVIIATCISCMMSVPTHYDDMKSELSEILGHVTQMDNNINANDVKDVFVVSRRGADTIASLDVCTRIVNGA